MYIREATKIDIPGIIRVENAAWPEGMSAREEMFESRIKVFPEGQLVAVERNEIIGVVSTEVINYDFGKPHKTWYQATDNGFLKKTHNPNGNVVFGVDLSVSPSARNRGVAKSLLQEIGKMAIKKNIQYGILGGRLPGYYKYADEMSADEYLSMVTTDGEPVDPELRFYKNSGLTIGELIPNYFEDFQSKNFGVQLIWKNPFYSKNKKIGKIIGSIFSNFFKL